MLPSSWNFHAADRMYLFMYYIHFSALYIEAGRGVRCSQPSRTNSHPCGCDITPIEDRWRRDNNLRDPAFSALQEVTRSGASGHSRGRGEIREARDPRKQPGFAEYINLPRRDTGVPAVEQNAHSKSSEYGY